MPKCGLMNKMRRRGLTTLYRLTVVISTGTLLGGGCIGPNDLRGGFLESFNSMVFRAIEVFLALPTCSSCHRSYDHRPHYWICLNNGYRTPVISTTYRLRPHILARVKWICCISERYWT